MNHRATFSHRPPKYAAELPTTAAMEVWRRATQMPMSMDLRVPSTVMANTSRPPWVVPSQWAALGGWRNSLETSRYPQGLILAPKTAKHRTRTRPTAPATAERLRRKRRRMIWARPRRLDSLGLEVSGSEVSRVSAGALPSCSALAEATALAPERDRTLRSGVLLAMGQLTLTRGSTTATKTSDSSAPVRVHSPEKATTAAVPLMSYWEMALTEYSPIPCQP